MKTAGIVTKTTKFSETSLIVTIITKDFGKISAIANNVRSSKSHLRMGLQLFAYNEIVLYEGKGKTGLYRLNEMMLVEAFKNIRTSIEKLAYASCFAEIANSAVTEDAPDEEALRLLLNSLYALDRDLCPPEKIKAVYEWRMAAIAGYEPQMDACFKCGETNGDMFLSLTEGKIFCEKCGESTLGCAKISQSMRQILTYICETESKRILSFEAGEKTIEYLSELGERYIQLQFDKNFPTLDYLKTVLNSEF